MAMFFGGVVAVIVYATTFFVFESFRINCYETEERKEAREQSIIEDFQSYVAERGLSTNDRDSILDFVKQKKQIYLLVNDIGYFDFSYSANDNATIVSGIYDLISIEVADYPTEEEMRTYAEANHLNSIEMADGLAFVSVADFSIYFYMLHYNINLQQFPQISLKVTICLFLLTIS